MTFQPPDRKHLSRLVPRSQNALVIAIIAVSVVDSVLLGYDSSLMGSLNVMPSYTSYFTLTTATKSLNTAISYVGGSFASLFSGLVVDWAGRKKSIGLSAVLTLIGAIIQTCAQNIGMFIAGRFIVGTSLFYLLYIAIFLNLLTIYRLRHGICADRLPDLCCRNSASDTPGFGSGPLLCFLGRGNIDCLGRLLLSMY